VNGNFVVFVDPVQDPANPSVCLRIVDAEEDAFRLFLSREQAEKFRESLAYAISRIPSDLGDESTWKFIDCDGCAKGGYPHPGSCLNAERMVEKNRRVSEQRTGP